VLVRGYTSIKLSVCARVYVCLCGVRDLEIVRNARQGLCSHNRAVACIDVGDRQNCCRSPLLCSRYKSYTNVVGKVCGQNLQTQTCTRATHICTMTRAQTYTYSHTACSCRSDAQHRHTHPTCVARVRLASLRAVCMIQPEANSLVWN
jgi:hypothetical protein